MKLRRSRLICRDVNRQSPRLCEPLCNSGPVSGSAGNKARLLLRTTPKGNPRSTLFALPQPESRRGAQLRQVSAVVLLRGTGSANPLSSPGESVAAGTRIKVIVEGHNSPQKHVWRARIIPATAV